MIFWNVHPENWGFMIQFDEHIFQMGGEKPPTSSKLKWKSLYRLKNKIFQIFVIFQSFKINGWELE